MGDEDRFDTEMLKLFSLPAGIEKEEVYDWILRNDVMIHEDQLCQAENPQMWYIIHVGMRNMKTIIKKLNKSIFGHPPNIKYINCAPVTLNTPQKAAYGIREPQDRPGNLDESYVQTNENVAAAASTDATAGQTMDGAAGQTAGTANLPPKPPRNNSRSNRQAAGQLAQVSLVNTTQVSLLVNTT